VTGRWPSRDPLGEAGFNLVNNRKLVESLRRVESEQARLRSEISGSSNSISYEDALNLLFNRLQIARMEKVTVRLKKRLSNGVDGALATANPYHFVFNQPVSQVDQFGLDIWVGDRPWSLHQNINVGDPNGEFDSYSFATDTRTSPFNPFNEDGFVYEDGVPTDVIEDLYLETTPEQDQIAQDILDSLVEDSENGERWPYRFTNQTCRSFSQDHLDFFRDLFSE